MASLSTLPELGGMTSDNFQNPPDVTLLKVFKTACCCSAGVLDHLSLVFFKLLLHSSLLLFVECQHDSVSHTRTVARKSICPITKKNSKNFAK